MSASWIKTLLNRMQASDCVLCRLHKPASDQSDWICDRCIDVMPWSEVVCERCGQPLAAQQPAGVFCGTCQQQPPPFHQARAPLHYVFPVDAALKRLKFNHCLYLAPAMAELMLPTLMSQFDHVDALLPVPIDRWRRLTRGFNQARELCRFLSAWTGLPIIDNCQKSRITKPQSVLTAKERRANLDGAFLCESSLRHKRILIVDDVITTGETCAAVSRALLENGAEEVNALAVAHASLN